MISRKKNKESILAVGLEEHRGSAVVLERNADTRTLTLASSFAMSVNLLKDAPDLAGSELRQHLDAARIHVKRCIFCVPARWVLCAQIEIPDLSEQDIPAFIALQSERQFPMAGDEIVYASSRYQTPGGNRGATLLALPRNRVVKLQAIARAAGLEIIGVTSPVAALARWNRPGESAVLFVAPERVELATTGLGGLVNLRALGDHAQGPGESGVFDHNSLARELRISLKRLPRDLSSALRYIEIYGDPELIPALLETVQAALGENGIQARRGTTDVARQRGAEDLDVDPALAAVVDLHLQGAGIQPNFLPPSPGRFEVLLRTALKRRTTSLIGAAAAVVLVTGLAFAFQARTLHQLESKMNALAPRSETAAALQDEIRNYRDWFDAGAPTLDIASGLTEAFPEEGSVWLKSASIKEGTTIVCNGKATGNRAWLDMLESLRATKTFGAIQVSQVRGDSPLDFTFSCTWLKGAR